MKVISMKHFLIFIFVLVSAFILVLYLLAFLFNDEPDLSGYDNCHKVWAHQGDHSSETGNSLQAYKKALENGATGIEMDVHFDEKTSEFIVSHDMPYSLHDGRLLYLKDVLGEISDNNSVNFWLDFKNLKKMSSAQVAESIALLDPILNNLKLKKRVIVESTGVVNLMKYKEAGYLTSYWVDLKDSKYLSNIRQVYYFYYGEFSYASMEYTDYDLFIKLTLPFAKVSLFTVNSINLLEKYAEDKRVRIILTDMNKYSHNSCL